MITKVEKVKIRSLVTDEVYDEASHAFELQNISVKARISRLPIIGTKTDDNRYMPIIGHLRCL